MPRRQWWTKEHRAVLLRCFLYVGAFPFVLLQAASGPTLSSNLAVTGVVVSSDPDALTWTIGNDDIRAVFRLLPSNDFVLEKIESPRTGRILNSAAAPDGTVTINGVLSALGSSAGRWTFDGAAATQVGNGVQLDFSFHSSRPDVTAVRSYVCYPGVAALEMWTTYKSTGPVSISSPSIWQISIPTGTVHYALGLRGDTAAAPTDSAFTLAAAALDSGDRLTLGSRERSSEDDLPLIAADTASDEMFGGLMWSGSWQMTAARNGSTLQIAGGLPGVFRAVDSAHPFETPHGFFGFTPGGLSSVAVAMRAFIVQGLRQGRSFQRLVTYNTWFAYGTDIDEQTLIDEMTAAAVMGAELFVVDAGWYLGAGRGLDFHSGLGTWEVDPARFPDGLGSLREFAHSLGIRFGLWVEPERVDRTLVNRAGLVPDAWLATENGDYKDGRTAQICFASDAAREWVLRKLFQLLDSVQPDYLKWDNNLWLNCNRAGHGHGTTDGNFAHVAGLYSVLDELRSRYPAMLIENCSQGGNRLDLGMLRYTDSAWMDDRTGPAVHVRHNLEGLMTFFPPDYLLSFAIADAIEPLIDAPDLPLYMRSRMPGILGLTYMSADLGALDRGRLAREIELSKRLRDLLPEASGRLLTEQVEPDGGPAWDIVQELDAVTGHAALFAFQNDPAVTRVIVRPEGLDSGAVYAVSSLDGDALGSFLGADLMERGIDIDGTIDSAAHVLVLQKDAQLATAGAVRRLRR